jgi:hypothetical protein
MNRYNVVNYIRGDKVGSCIFLEEAGNKRDPKYGKYRRIAKFRCECGKEFITSVSAIKRGAIKSCGCYNRRKVIESSTKHGLCKHPLYGQWQDIKNRCNNPNVKGYEQYGKRGIKVCDEWMKEFLPFYNWAKSNNWKWGLSIDRIDNNGNYEPSNCRLATSIEQARNRSNNLIVEYKGEKMCIAELCERLGLKYTTILNRISKRKWSVERAISTEIKSDKIKRLNGRYPGEI